MDDNDRRRLQRLYDAASTSSTTGNSDALASAQNFEADNILNQQRHQQHLLQREITSTNAASSSSRNNNQQSEEQMLWLLRNNPVQQLQEINNFNTSNLDSTGISALRNARALQQNIDHTIGAGNASQPGQSNTDDSISLLMRNIQQRKNESELAAQSQQYRDLMISAAMARGDVGNIDIRSLLNDTSGMSYLNQRHLDSLSRPQQPSMYQNLLSTQNLPLLSETDLLLSGARTNFAQRNVATSNYLGNTGINVTDSGLNQQFLMDEYLRSQQNDLHAARQAYQNQQLLDSYDGQSRLAFLIQQRQQLEHQQSVAASLNAPRNISLKNDEPVEKDDLEETKIRKVEAFIEKPKRPLSAYNIFFRQERQKLLGEGESNEDVVGQGSIEEAKDGDDVEDKKPAAVADVLGSKKRKRGKPHHKVTFEQMAKIIGQRWKELESDETKKKHYQDIALKDKERYQAEIVAWKQQRNALSSKYRKKNDAP